MEWKPIESAPRDGTQILIWSTHGEFYIVVPHLSYDAPKEDFTKRWTWKEKAGMYGIYATHWTPLTEPQKEQN